MVNDPREAARAMLEVIKSSPEMPKNRIAHNFSFVLLCLWQIHNLTVEPEARLIEYRIVRITPEIVELLNMALSKNAMPLIKHLSPLVDYDPTLLASVLP